MNKFSFSGHESFHCRNLWLKKGFDFLKEKNRFSNPDSVIELGVGKNMVNSINYWMNSTGLINEEKELSKIAEYLFGENGKDPYLEDIASLWLLHYYIVKENRASIYSLFFNEFRKLRNEFSRKQFDSFLIRKCEIENLNISSKTIERDVAVFIRNYVKPKNKKNNLEDAFSGIFLDLNLIEQPDSQHKDIYLIENTERNEIPWQIVLFSIIDNQNYSRSISLHSLLFDNNSIGNIFCINSAGLLKKIESITNNKEVVFSDDAGIRELQFKVEIDPFDILNEYYEK